MSHQTEWGEETIEKLAAIEHERWASWQQWMHGICKLNADGSITIYSDLVERWERQIKTPYSELSEKEKESDREQVRRYLPIFATLIAEAREEGIKFAEGMAIHQGEEKERTRVSKILKSKLEDMPSSADDSIYPLIVESRNKLINEALLAINVQE